jgi:hypothetical protein
MIDINIPSMYGFDNDAIVVTPKVINDLTEESYIEARKHIAIINLGDSKVAVPTVAHVQEIVKDVVDLRRQVRQLSSENRRMRMIINKMNSDIRQMQISLDNKLDKL